MIKKFLFIILFLLPLTIQASHFPLGIYCISSPKDIKIIKKAGFDTIQSYAGDISILESLANKAQKHGIEILFYPDKIQHGVIQKAKDWPVAAWYIYDEPGVHHLTANKLEELNVAAKEKFPEDKTAFVVGKASNLKPYTDIADIIMVDWYPVPHLALTSLGEQI